MIPMDPANETRTVLAFFVIRLFKERDSAVKNDIDDFPRFLCSAGNDFSSITYGFVSDKIWPSFTFTIRFA